MTRDERIEAIARAIAPKAWATVGQVGADTLANQNRRTASIRHARAAINAAYPELAAGTHWIAPREMTKEMVDAAEDRFEDFKDTTQDSYGSYLVISSGYAYGLYTAARDAYLKQEGGE